MRRPDYLTEWDFFVWRHKKAGNLALHFISLSLFLVSVPAGLLTADPRWLIPAILSAPIGTAGHYLFRDGGVRARDFTAPRTLVSLIVIYSMILRGTYSAEVARVGRIVSAHGGADHG